MRFQDDCGEYTWEQMSVILRTECLTGGSKHLVENLFEYHEIWDQLDRDYDDEGQVIQQIIQQITDFKEISDENKEAFIQFVDLIFKAHTDINAFTSSAILAHPVIVSTILKKCPPWAAQDLCSEMAKQKIKTNEQFEFIRRQLVVLREQAREMAKLRKCAYKAGPVKGARPQGQNLVRIIQHATVLYAAPQGANTRNHTNYFSALPLRIWTSM